MAMMEETPCETALRDLGCCSRNPRAAVTRCPHAVCPSDRDARAGLKNPDDPLRFLRLPFAPLSLEAGVRQPAFKEIEDRAAELLRADILDTMAEGRRRSGAGGLRHYTALISPR